jgi:hypothetical protein
MTSEPVLIVQIPRDSALDRQLRAEPPASVLGGEVQITHGPTDAEGNLEALATGETVMSMPSPETLRREPQEVRRVLAHAGEGTEPLVIEVDVAEELCEAEIAAVLDAARHAPRATILRVVRGVA